MTRDAGLMARAKLAEGLSELCAEFKRQDDLCAVGARPDGWALAIMKLARTVYQQRHAITAALRASEPDEAAVERAAAMLASIECPQLTWPDDFQETTDRDDYLDCARRILSAAWLEQLAERADG